MICGDGPYEFLENYRAVLKRANIPHPFNKTVRSGYWPAPKKTDEQKADEKERARFLDNMQREGVEATLWLGISREDYNALQVIADSTNAKNYAVIVRRLIHKEAKRIAKEK